MAQASFINKINDKLAAGVTPEQAAEILSEWGSFDPDQTGGYLTIEYDGVEDNYFVDFVVKDGKVVYTEFERDFGQYSE